MAGRRRGLLRAVVLVSVILFLRLCGLYPSLDVFPLSLSSAHVPANSTLGFGAVYVLSGYGSPRRDHLVQSANVTGLDVTIPEQPQWTEKDESNFKAGGDAEMNSGSVFAWLGHDFILENFLASDFESALVLEDDVDWDIRLRSAQIPAAAAAVRSFLSTYPSSSSSSSSSSRSKGYWGDPTEWDLLYIGHCGDYFDSVDINVGVGHLSPSDLGAVPYIIYEDQTLLPRWQLHPYTASFLTSIGMPEKSRVVHQSVWPLCSFAYAVSRTGAKLLRERVAVPVASAVAFDVAILNGCREGRLRCMSVNPELFHHVDGDSLIAHSAEHAFRPPVDEKGLEQTIKRGETSNIGCGFWGTSFEFNDDMERLAYLRREVGEKGRCLKNGRT